MERRGTNGEVKGKETSKGENMGKGEKEGKRGGIERKEND